MTGHFSLELNVVSDLEQLVSGVDSFFDLAPACRGNPKTFDFLDDDCLLAAFLGSAHGSWLSVQPRSGYCLLLSAARP